MPITKARQLAELIANSLVDSDEISTGAVTTSKLASTLDFSSKTMVMADNQLSGDKIHGGTVSAFASTGIDDNASATAVTILSDGKVGVGYTSPNEKLHVNGHIEASAGYKLASHPVLDYTSFDGGYSTRLGSTGTSTLNATQIFAGGSVQATFKGGNVGIGTTSPAGKLNVVSTAHNNGAIFDSTGTAQLWLRDTDAGSNQKNWGFQISGGDFNIIRANDDRASGFVTPIYMQQAPNNSLVINSSGHIGFGHGSPSAPIDVVTNSNVYAAEFTQSNTANGDGVSIVIGSTAAVDYALTVRSDAGNTSVLAAKADGKVGIGVFSPFADLTVGSSTTFNNGDNYISAVFQPAISGGESAGMLFGHYPATGYAKQGIFWERYVGSTGSGGQGKLHFVNRAATDTSVPTLADTRMTIDHLGNVGIGTTSPGSRRVKIEGSSSAYPLALDSTNSDYQLEFQKNGTSEWWIAASARSFKIHENGVGDKLTVTSAGNVIIQDNLQLTGGGVISSNGTTDTIVLSGSNAEHVGASITLHGNAHSNASQTWFKAGSSIVMTIAGGNVLVGTQATNGTTDFTSKLIAGTFSTKWGAQNNMAVNTWTTIFTFGNNEGNFMVSARGSGTGNINDNTTGIVHVQASSQSAYAALLAGSRVQLRMSGLALQCNQTMFTGANVNWNIVRICT